MRFGGALSLLRWMAAVMMPRGSADVRGEQLRRSRRTSRAAHDAEGGAPIERAEAGSSQLEDWPLANAARDAAPTRPCQSRPRLH